MPVESVVGASAVLPTVSIHRDDFGAFNNSERITRITLQAGRIRAKILSYGAVIQELWVPDRDDVLDDVVLGFDTVDPYITQNPFFGCVVGRHAGRLVSPFDIDGTKYSVAGSDGGGGGIDPATNLHGGKTGWDKKNWKVSETGCNATSAWVTLTHISPDGDEGFPGTVHASVTYTVTDKLDLVLRYNATTDKKTIVSMTNHSYFNLNGTSPGEGNTIADHSLELLCDHYAIGESTGSGIPTGVYEPVHGTVMDFTRTPNAEPRRLGPAIEEILAASPEWPHGEGFFVRGVEEKRKAGTSADTIAVSDELPTAAVVRCGKSGRIMTVRTSEPQLQTYYATFLDGTLPGKRGAVYPKYGGLCLECQRCSNAIHLLNFPPQTCSPDQPYNQRTVYSFANEQI